MTKCDDLPTSTNNGEAKSTKPEWRMFVLLSLGVLLALIGRMAYQIAFKASPSSPSRNASAANKPTENVGHIRDEAWQRVGKRLEEADGATKKLTNQLAHKIEAFFDERKSGSEAFAEAALGLRSKLRLWSREKHREFLKEQFSQYIFSQDEMEHLLKQVATEYEQGIKEAENTLLVSAHADVGDLTRDVFPAFANEQVLSKKFGEVFPTVAARVSTDAKITIGKELASFVITEAIAKSLAAVATRLGISATLVSAGTAASTVTVGAGLVLFIGVDLILDRLTKWFYDPVGNLSAKVNASLDDMKDCIISGVPDAWLIRDQLAEMANNDPDSEVKARAAEALDEIERGGALGLKHSLNRVAEAYKLAREQTLHQLVYGEVK